MTVPDNSTSTTSTTRFKKTMTEYDAKGYSFNTKMAFGLTITFLVSMGVLSAVYAPSENDMTPAMQFNNEMSPTNYNRFLDQDDRLPFEQYNCKQLYEVTFDSEERCEFSKVCGDGEGVLAPWVFCTTWMPQSVVYSIFAPLCILFLLVLFRLLGSTAEDFFSPSLEMFSNKLGLPPRFAGVSLLAFGNGAADVSAAINAISGDPENGYKLSLGALSGAAMFVSGVVSAMVVLAAGGVPCRGALVRDVSMLMIVAGTVYFHVSSGEIGPEAITQFTTLYGLFVLLVLVADTYHRAVVLPRRKRREIELEEDRQTSEAQIVCDDDGNFTVQRMAVQSAESGPGTPTEGKKTFGKLLTAVSNYSFNGSARGVSGWSDAEDMEHEHLVKLHGPEGILGQHLHPHGNPLGQANPQDLAEHGLGPSESHPTTNYAMLQDITEEELQASFRAAGPPATSWRAAFEEGTPEFLAAMNEAWEDIAWNGDLNRAEKFLGYCEFPFIVLRKVTVPIPSEGYYCRAMLAMSMVVSPWWLLYYFWNEHEVTIFSSKISFLYVGLFVSINAVFGACIMRFAPSGDGSLPMYLAAPIALYGFVIGATWIDAVAGHLVALLEFIGILLRIPGPIIGLTILAWGNSAADFSANVTMARKGLANMAMTACFAGPVFNILIGLSLGFSARATKTGEAVTPVSLATPVKVGLTFLAINCISILSTGIYFGKGRIPRVYGYVGFSLYGIYLVSSIGLQYLW